MSSFYSNLASCYDENDKYVEEKVKSEVLEEEAKRVVESILEFITTTEVACLGRANLEESMSAKRVVVTTPTVVEEKEKEEKEKEKEKKEPSLPAVEGEIAQPEEAILSQDSTPDHPENVEEEKKMTDNTAAVTSLYSPSSSSSSSSDEEILHIPLAKVTTKMERKKGMKTTTKCMNEEHDSAVEEIFDSSDEVEM